MDKVNFLNVQVITPWSQESMCSKLTPGGNSSIAAPTSAAYPEANLAIYVPFFVVAPMVVDQLFCFNGATVSGNVDIGIYDAGKRRVVSTGSTAQSGVNTIQAVNVADTTIGPGLFFVALAMDNTTGTLTASGTGLAAYLAANGIYQQASAFALPVTATFAAPTRDYIPLFGLTSRSLI